MLGGRRGVGRKERCWEEGGGVGGGGEEVLGGEGEVLGGDMDVIMIHPHM